MKVWCRDPNSGVKIPPKNYPNIAAQVSAYEAKKSWYPAFKVQLRFKGQFCYLDGIQAGKNPFPIGRLRYFGGDWSLAFYAYSTESYKLCVFNDGNWFGPIEAALDICTMYFTD